MKRIDEIRIELRGEISGVREEISGVKNEISGIKNEMMEVRKFMIRYLIPVAVSVGAVVSYLIYLLTR